MQDYIAETAPEEAVAAFITFMGPAGGPLGEEVTKCVEVLWNDEEIRQLEIVDQYKQPHSLLETALAFREVDGIPIVAAADAERTVHLWDVRSDCLLERSLSGHEARVTAIAFGKLDSVSVVITGTSGGTVRLWNVRTGQLLGKPLRGHEGRITTVALGEVDGISTVISGGEDRSVRTWNARTGQRRDDLAIEGQPLAVDVASGVPLLVISNCDGTVQVWDVDANRALGGPVMGHEGLVTALGIGEVDDKRILASGGEDSTVRLWDVRSGKQWGVPLRGPEQPISAVAFGEIGGVPILAAVDEYDTIRLWNVRAGVSWREPIKCLHTFDTQRDVPEKRALYDARDVQERTKLYEESGLRLEAEAGNAIAQWKAYKVLGNTSEGYKWLCRAADHGYTAAQSELGFLYALGPNGFTQDYTKAFVWYRLAASGRLKKDVDKALNLRKKRADCRNVDAQVCYIAQQTAWLMGILKDQGIARAEQLLQQWQPGQCERELVTAKSDK